MAEDQLAKLKRRVRRLERKVKALEAEAPPPVEVLKREAGVSLIRDPDPFIPFTVIDREGGRHSYLKLKEAKKTFEYYVGE